ncbi:MAG: hypothetical protein Q4B27_00685 [Candidatus Saccharibacteria bacterium]|nr:hypothetical protein [Candidatus Saccharibacteria bacterium]
MSHEYSDTPKVRVDSTGYRHVELPVDGTQRPELAPSSVQRTIGTVAITKIDGTAPMYYIQDTLDAGLDSPLFPAPEASESSRQQNNNSAVKGRHPADMEPEI